MTNRPDGNESVFLFGFLQKCQRKNLSTSRGERSKEHCIPSLKAWLRWPVLF